MKATNCCCCSYCCCCCCFSFSLPVFTLAKMEGCEDCVNNKLGGRWQRKAEWRGGGHMLFRWVGGRRLFVVVIIVESCVHSRSFSAVVRCLCTAVCVCVCWCVIQQPMRHPHCSIHYVCVCVYVRHLPAGRTVIDNDLTKLRSLFTSRYPTPTHHTHCRLSQV